MADEGLGWQVATFAYERLEADDTCSVGSSAIWDSYVTWCGEKNAVPLAFAVFHAEFERIAEQVGMKRRQTGAHVNYDGVKLDAAVS